MDRKLTAALLAAAFAVSPIPFVATTTPAVAQVNVSVSFGYFYDELSPYGQWYRHPRWGDVWRPTRVERDFRPYYRGYWEPTREYGWVWQSDYAFGDVTFHYGRWVYDRSDGWLWVPGYVWAPAWVVWRGNNDYLGWFPMPPDERFLGGYEDYRDNWNTWDRGFGYADWYGPQAGLSLSLSFWNFVDRRHFADRDYVRYQPPRNQFTQIINNTTNITNYTTVNNVVVNRSVDIGQIERASGRRFNPVPAQQVVRAPITPVNVGTQVQTRERRFHGGDPNASAQARVAVLPPNAARNPTPRDQQPGAPFREPQAQQPQQGGQPAEQRNDRGGRFGRGGEPNQPQQAAPNQQPGPAPNEQQQRRGGPQFGRPSQEPNQGPQGAPNRPEQGPAPNEQVRRGGPPEQAPQGGPNRQEQGPPPNEQVRRGGPPDQGRPAPNEQIRRGGPPEQGPPPNEQVRRGAPPDQGPPQNEQVRRGPPPDAQQAQPDENNGKGRGNNRRGAEAQPAPNAPPAQVTQREQPRPPESGPPARQFQQPPPQAAPQPPPRQEGNQANAKQGNGNANPSNNDDEEKNRRGRGRGPN